MNAGETTLHDEAARARIAADLDTNLVVEAAAGTGKTSALVGRMVAALAAGRAEIGEVVAVTFTEAAAGELKLRLRGALEHARTSPSATDDQRRRLLDALARLEEARVGTIHAFCTDLLRERPVEAGVDPDFEVAADDVARALMERTVDRWFEEELAHPCAAVQRLVRRRTEDDESPREALRSAAWELAEHRDYVAPWHAAPFARESAIDALIDDLRALGDYAPHGDRQDYLQRSLESLRRFVEDTLRREAVTQNVRDYDGLEARLITLSREKHWGWRGGSRDEPAFPRSKLRAQREACKQRLDAFLAAAGAELAHGLREALLAVLPRYAEAKRRAGQLDFLDLLLHTRALLRDDARARGDLQRRFRLLFVDEFQDTDPLQAEILFLLASADPQCSDWRSAPLRPGKLFLVGDPKQSIYRFRRADVSLYEGAKSLVVASGGACVELTASFRAVPELQSAVNAAFAPIMLGAVLPGDRPSQARYVPLTSVRPSRGDAQPAVVALPVPAPYSDKAWGRGPTPVNFAIERSVPDAVAAFIDWLVRESGYVVREDKRDVPVRPEHVCLLFRRLQSRYSDVAPRYLRALEARQLPHVLVGGPSFQERDEVRGLLNALLAIERPDDALSTYAALKGPLFALNDGALLAWRERFGGLHAYRGGHLATDARAALSTEVREVGEALDVLRALHRGRNRRPFAETVQRLLRATRAHAGLAFWPTGEQALANVARLLEIARRAERRGLASFRAFTEAVESAAEGNASDAPAFEQDARGVRLMTVHKAKGLEFPVVILADITNRETPTTPSRFTDAQAGLCAMRLCGATPREVLEHADVELRREREEAARLLYVAATRARDMLVVPAVADARIAGWTSALYPALYPDPAHARAPRSRVVAGAPAFTDDATVTRPGALEMPATAVMPGVHVPMSSAATHTVAWWDAHALDLGREEQVGLRQQRLLEADATGQPWRQGVEQHGEWLAHRASTRTLGARPEHTVVTATRAALATDDPELDARAAAVGVELVDIEPSRPGGKRFGELVHATLAALDFAGGAADIAPLIEAHRRLLTATEDEGRAAQTAITRALGHPLLVRLRAAALKGQCRREVGVCFARGDTLIEGVIDAAFRDEHTDGWLVVDFKTDAALVPMRAASYKRQVALYALGIEAATGQPARGVLLRI